MSRSTLQGCQVVDATAGKPMAVENAIQCVRKALSEIRYGEIIIKVQDGKPIWVDKYERERVG